ncbi:MAG TPA: cytochrome c-type biogenesis CcmF C-terminal domain-containing protein [Nocardioides sp.]|uniref:heme lyase CcmF/NrfE family subunit n=1 Tax=Nocardioides sp. TaxID=35761 RepID=UPI002F427BBF
MTGWVGTFALAAAFCSALACVGVWASAALRPATRQAPRWLGLLPLLAAGATVGAAEYALLTHDFSIRFVAENGSLSTPAYYTVTSLWAAHDGSLLLWVLILTAYVAVLGWRTPAGARRLHAWAVSCLSTVAAFFAGLALFTGQVFDRVQPAPADGPGPNPLLADHPAMGVHPPLLYAGLLGTAVLFSYAVAALVTGRADGGWARVVRPWALWTWSVLTAGIVMGAWWSYTVLGWGGYWAWDPVENAALLPWLLTTALLHSGMVLRRSGALPAWSLSLAVGAFVLAGLGVFITRSGVSVSVHTFASSGVGVVLLAFLAAVLAGVVALALLRPGGLGSPRGSLGPVLSRTSAILANNVLLVVLAVTVLVGTLFPVLADAVNGSQVAVGPSYFDTVSVPVVGLLLALMGLGPYLRWRGDRGAAVLRRALLPAAVGAAVVVCLAVKAPTGRAALVTFGLAGFVLTGIVRDVVRRVGSWGRVAGMGAHLGFVLLLVGVAGSSAYAVAGEGTVTPGHSHRVAGVDVAVSAVSRDRSAGDIVTRAGLVLRRGDRTVRLSPGLRYSPAHDMTVAVPAVSSRVGGDLYVTLLSADRNGAVTVRVARNPMVGWIWAGGAVMALAGLGSLLLRRRRRRAPARAAVPEPAPAPPLAVTPDLAARAER